MVGVLNVQTWNWPAQRVLLLFALLVGALGSHQEIQVGVPTGRPSIRSILTIAAIEAEDTVGLVSIGDVELVANVFAAKDDLVFAAQQSYIVIEGQSVVVELGDRVGAAADGEFVGRRQLQAVRLALIGIHAKGGGIDIVGSISAVVAAPHHGNVRGVHDLRT